MKTNKQMYEAPLTMKIVVKADGVFCTSDIDAGAGLGSWDNAGGDAWGGGSGAGGAGLGGWFDNGGGAW